MRVAEERALVVERLQGQSCISAVNFDEPLLATEASLDDVAHSIVEVATDQSVRKEC